jgi:N4-gp56 family major capsid protein
MANNFIDVQSQAIVIASAMDTLSLKPLLPRYVFDGVAKQKVWNLNNSPIKGDTIEFPVLAEVSANTAALDPTNATRSGSVKTSYTRSSVSLSLYGDHSTIDMLQFRPETFVDISSDVVFTLQDQAMKSINNLARNVLDLNKYTNEASGTLSSTYHYYGSQGTGSSNIGPLKAIDVREVRSDLQAANVEPFADGYYIAICGPKVANQLRAETGNAAWGAAVLAGDASVQRRFNGDIGTFEGCRFIVDNTVTVASGGGTATSYFVGQDSLGKAIGFDARVQLNPIPAGNHHNLYTYFWDALLGYKVIRREGVRIVSTTNVNL